MSGAINKGNLGILAGEGELPHQLVAHCQSQAIDVSIVTFDGCRYQPFPDIPHCHTRLEKVGEIFDFLKKQNVSDVVMIGNLGRPKLSALRPDFKGLRVLAKIGGAFALHGDDSLLRLLRREIESEGFHVKGIDYYVPGLTFKEGCHTRHPLTITDSIDSAIREALHHGRADKGQSVLVDIDGNFAYEDRLGTQHLIETHGTKGAVLVKILKPQQDPDLDRPTVGIETLRILTEKGCAGLVVQADSVFAVNKQTMIDYANEHNLFIEAINV